MFKNSFLYNRVIWFFSLSVFLFLQCTRLITVFFLPNVDAQSLNLMHVFGYGLLVDLIVSTVFLGFFGLMNSIYPKDKIESKEAFFHMSKQIAVSITLIVFFMVGQVLFFSIYGSQINLQALVNLLDPIPILKNIWMLFPVVEIVIGSMIFGIILYLIIKKSFIEHSVTIPTVQERLVGLGVMTMTILLSAMLYAASDYKNMDAGLSKQLSSNSFYSLTQLGKVSPIFTDDYASISQQESIDLLKSEYNIKHSLGGLDLLKKQINNQQYALAPEEKLNVIVILGESFSVNSQGKIPGNNEILAPYFSSLTKDGQYYENIYATGQSTTRALSAVFYSVPPLPSYPLLLRHTHNELNSLPKILKKNGYHTLFVYGGDATYNSRDTLIANPEQFDSFVDKRDFKATHTADVSSWGFHDEFVMDKAIQTINQLDHTKPFFASILTLSNHSPHTLPHDFHINETQSDRNNAIRYADKSLGQFMEQAKKQPWFDNTLFVVLADHGPYRALNPTFPMVDYKIPLLFYAPKYIKPMRSDIVASEIDLAPTLLAKLGINYESTFFGRNIDDQEEGSHPVFLTKFESFGVLIDETLVQLYPGKQINTWRTQNRESFAKIELSDKEPVIREAISYLQGFSEIMNAVDLKKDVFKQ